MHATFKLCFLAILLSAWFGIGLIAASAKSATASETAAPPNIVFILADDLAWADLGCYGHDWHQTPHLDALAKSGMRFTNAYSPAPICSAARASILTGKTVARLQFEFVTKDKPGSQQIDTETELTAPPYTLNLPLEEYTMAERLSAAGYECAFFGKWHLNQHHQRYLGWSPTHGPRQQGFDVAEEDFGSHPYDWKQHPPKPTDKVDEYAVDTMVERVCKFIGGKHERPYFVMASMFFVHTPVKSPYDWLLKKYEAEIPTDAPLRDNRVKYAAFVSTLDHYVGQMVTAVETSDAASNTVIVFLSDNGGHPEYTGNAPLRGSKWNLYEGGIRVPMLAAWPKQIKAGSTCDQPVIGYDLLPTFVELAHGDAGKVDGVSLAGVFRGDKLANRHLLWHFPYYHPEKGYGRAKESIGANDFAVSKTRPQSAIRRGKHKLLWFAEDDRYELYDLASDLAETHDLSEEHPKLTQELADLLEKSLTEMNARRAQRK